MSVTNSEATVIPREDISCVDIVLGRDRKSFNNTGNRRFRFIVAFNLDRYRAAHTRRAKSSVVESIVSQIRQAGGRFLIKYDADLFVEAPDKISKEKVSHALRDKYPIASISQAAKKFLRDAPNSSEGREVYYKTATERLLLVSLPESVRSSDENVELILTGEIEALCGDFMSPRCGAKSGVARASSLTPEIPRQVSPVMLPFPADDFAFDDSRLCGSLRMQHPEDVVADFHSDDRAKFTEYRGFQPLENVLSWEATSCQQPGLVASDGSFDDARFYEVEDESLPDDILITGDLPQSFSEADCENLIAMLDFASSL